MEIFLAALLGALAMFLWEFVAHILPRSAKPGLGLCRSRMPFRRRFSRPSATRLECSGFPTGGLTDNRRKTRMRKAMERIMEEMKTKPSGLSSTSQPEQSLISEKPWRSSSSPTSFKALLAAWLLTQTQLITFGSRVGFVLVAGVLAAIATNIPLWNWHGFDGTFTMANVFMEIAGFFFAGLAIVAVLKRSPTAATT